MSSIKQQIPSFIQGMSDQPDELKKPGQVRSLTNAIPDVAQGLQKRPGIEYLNTLEGSDEDGKWLNIFAENSIGFEEQYICNISKEGVVNVWAAVDIQDTAGNVIIPAGDPVPTVQPDGPSPLSLEDSIDFTRAPRVTSAIDYFKHDAKDQLQSLNIGATTLVSNRGRTPTMSSTEIDQDVYKGFVSLKNILNGRVYQINVIGQDGTGSDETFTSVSSLAINSGGSYQDPNSSCSKADSQTYYNQSSGGGTNLAYRFTVNCQVVPKGDAYDSLYTADVTLINGGQGWQVGQVFPDPMGFGATIRVASVNTTRIENVLHVIYPPLTPITGEGEALTGGQILSDIKAGFDATGFFSVVKVIGSGVYVESPSQFTLATPEDTLMDVLSTTTEAEEDPTPGSRYTVVNNAGLLPTQCRHNLVAKVANSFEEGDDYYLKFQGNEQEDGPGVWEETYKPGIAVAFNPDSMPYLIRRSLDADGQIVFKVGSVDWIQRTVGDNKTNPIPSFVKTDEAPGVSINNMLLYRNRLVFLSSNNVILSQSGDLGNWFGDTALVLKASDPIDINASVDTSTALYAGLVVNNGMVIFSKFNQFLFTTDSDILSPETAKSSLLSTYDFNINSNPFNLASNVGFFSSSGNDSIFWWMKDIYREGPPVVNEQSKAVSRSLPPDLDLITESREDGLVLASTKGIKDIWGYRFFLSGDQQVQSAWFKWTMPGEVLFHYNNTRGKYWIIYKDALGNTQLGKIDLRDQMRAVTLEGQPYEYNVYLDNWASVTPTYDSSTRTSTFTLPYQPAETVKAYSLDTDNYRGRSIEPTMNGSVGTLPGNWSDAEVAIGYEYEMNVEMPTIYVTSKQGNSYQSDTSARLTLHRVQMYFGNVGVYTIDLKRYGKDDYTMLYEATEMDGYDADRPAVYADKMYIVPVYDRNKNCNLTLRSAHPTPATLHSMTFEGDYTNNYYKRV